MVVERAPEEERAGDRERREERVRIGDPAVRPERHRGEEEERAHPRRPLFVEARREQVDQRDRQRGGERADQGHRAVRVVREQVHPTEEEHVVEVARRLRPLVERIEALHAAQVQHGVMCVEIGRRERKAGREAEDEQRERHPPAQRRLV